MLERPAHMARLYGDKTDMDGVPDDTTGTDYEQLDDTARKYDSDNEEFEILWAVSQQTYFNVTFILLSLFSAGSWQIVWWDSWMICNPIRFNMKYATKS